MRLRSFLYVSTSVPGGTAPAVTTSFALRLVVLPTASVTTTEKALPLSFTVVAAVVKIVEVAPAMGDALFCH